VRDYPPELGYRPTRRKLPPTSDFPMPPPSQRK
jgi:hypothetical protein